MEKYWINKYQSFANTGFGYNITRGGEFGDVTAGMTDEQYDSWVNNLSKAQKGENNGFFGKTHSEETRKN